MSPPSMPIKVQETVCDSAICKKTVKEQLDVIRARNELVVSIPEAQIPGFTTLKKCSICKKPIPGGFIGRLVKAISTAVFGKYSQSNTEVVLSGSDKFKNLYNGVVDLDVSFTIPTNKPRKFKTWRELSVSFDSSTPILETDLSFVINPLYYKKCKLCKHLDIRGKLIRAAFQKLHYEPSATTFSIVSKKDSNAAHIANVARMLFGKEIHDKTGLKVVSGTYEGEVSSLGKRSSIMVTGESINVELDVIVGTDFIMQLTSDNVVHLSSEERKKYNFDVKDTHAITYRYDALSETKNTALKNIVDGTLACLIWLDEHEIHTVEDLEKSDPWIKYKVSDNEVCNNILSNIGSMKTLKDKFAEESVISYSLQTNSASNMVI